jgi:hypothetical protein
VPSCTIVGSFARVPRLGTSHVFRFVVALNAAWGRCYPRTPKFEKVVSGYAVIQELTASHPRKG